jgi:hypothetical protein
MKVKEAITALADLAKDPTMPQGEAAIARRMTSALNAPRRTRAASKGDGGKIEDLQKKLADNLRALQAIADDEDASPEARATAKKALADFYGMSDAPAVKPKPTPALDPVHFVEGVKQAALSPKQQAIIDRLDGPRKESARARVSGSALSMGSTEPVAVERRLAELDALRKAGLR